MEKEKQFAAALSEGLKMLDDDTDQLVELIANMAEETLEILNLDNRELHGLTFNLKDSHEFAHRSELNEIEFTDSEEEQKEEEEENSEVAPIETAIAREQKRFARMLNIRIQKRPA